MTSRNPDDYELLQPQSRFSAGRIDADRAGCGDRAPFLLEGKRSFGGLRRAAAHPRVRAVLFAVALLAVGASVAAVLPAAARRGPFLPGSAPPGELPAAADAGPLDNIVNIGGNPAPDALGVGKGGPPGGAPAESSGPPEKQQQPPRDTPSRTLATASGTATLTSPTSPGPYTIPGENTLSASGASPQVTELFSASKTADDSLSSSAPASSSAGECETRNTCDGVGGGGVSRSAASDSDVESATSDPYDAAITSASTSADPAFSTEAGTPNGPASTVVYIASKAGGCAAGTLCDAVDAVGVPTSTAPDGDVESTVSFDPFGTATVTSMADDLASTTEVASKSAPPATKPVFDDGFYKLEGECATGIPCDEVDTGGMSTSAAPDDDAESPTSFDSFDAATVTSTSDDPTCTTAAAPNDPPAITQPAGDGFHELGRVGDSSGGAGSISEASPPDASTAAQTTTAAGWDLSANPTGIDAAGEITHEIQPFASSDATQTPAAGPDTGESLTGEIAGGDTAQSLLPAPPAETTNNGAGDSVVGGEAEIIDTLLPSTGAASPEVPSAEGGTETGDVATPATKPSPSSDDVGGGAFSAEAAELLADGGFF